MKPMADEVVAPLPDHEFVRLRMLLHERLRRDIQRQFPGYHDWLRDKAANSKPNSFDVDRIVDGMGIYPLPGTFQRAKLWRDVVATLEELADGRDELAITLFLLETLPRGALIDVAWRHEYEGFVLRYDALVKIARSLVKKVGRHILRTRVPDWNGTVIRLLEPLDGVDATEWRDQIAHSHSRLRDANSHTWPIFAFVERHPAVPLPLDHYGWWRDDANGDVSRLRVLAEEMNGRLEEVCGALRSELERFPNAPLA